MWTMSIFVHHMFSPAQSPGVRKAGILCPVASVGTYAALPFFVGPNTLDKLGMYTTSTPGGTLALTGTETYTGTGFIAAILFGAALFCVLLAVSYYTFLSQEDLQQEDVWGAGPAHDAAAQQSKAAHAADLDEANAEEANKTDNFPLPEG